MKALMIWCFDGVIRPDHGRTIWGEVANARIWDGLIVAMGITYLPRIAEAIMKAKGKGKKKKKKVEGFFLFLLESERYY